MVDNYWKRKFDDLLRGVTVITNGKQMYFEQDDGSWYSRFSGKNLTVDEAIKECLEDVEFWAD